jgi:DNA-binding transcriptional ArsR family regulator/uncharacterized protein YndB with AHSA1/START domain
VSRRVVPDEEPLWRALADPTRRAILDALRDGPRTTGALAANFPTTRYTVMEHLGVLAGVGLVVPERRGRERLNHLNPVPLGQAYERWVRPLADTAADTLLRLEESATPRSDPMDIRATHDVPAAPHRVWRSVVDLPAWWPARWRDNERLVFEPRVGGRLGPTTDDLTDGELWGVVTVLRPGAELTVDGAMGMSGPVVGQWRLLLEPTGNHTQVTLTHRVLGDIDDETRDCYAAGWPETLAALAAHAT